MERQMGAEGGGRRGRRVEGEEIEIERRLINIDRNGVDIDRKLIRVSDIECDILVVNTTADWKIEGQDMQ